ncbi:MAG: aspartate--tRNA(Asn) ligase [Candidatus Aenigmarchaeota archaeon]|nr:aspartate--tRNA(Asn) ligase [Candidatus Aenigmarchaeota archaeon]
MLRTHYFSEIKKDLDGKEVTIAGWARNIRDTGKIKFLIVADRTGETQVLGKVGETDDKVLEDMRKIDKEDVVSIRGTVRINEKAPGGKEIIPLSVTVLNKAEKPLPLDLNVKSNLDTRLNYRYLDLRRPEVRAIFRVRDVIQRSFVRYLEENGFILVNTPSIVAAATEGGTNLFPISYFDTEAFLVQSPQLYKQILMASGLDKVIIQCPVFRAEEHDTSFHLNESMQMDIEMAFINSEPEVLHHLAGVIKYIYSRLAMECAEEMKILGRDTTVPKEIKQITYDEARDIVNQESELKWGDDFTPEMQRIINKKYNPAIVTKWPTDLRAFYSMPEPGNEKICRAYDLLIDGVEISSGAQRIHKHDELVKEMKRRGMNPDNFEFYLNAFRHGMPPHGGWSIGLDRLTMVITGMKNVRECVLFPRDRKRLTP